MGTNFTAAEIHFDNKSCPSSDSREQNNSNPKYNINKGLTLKSQIITKNIAKSEQETTVL